MKMNILLLSALLFMATCALCSVDAAGQVKVITNEDLKKYGAKDREESNDAAAKQETPPQKTEAAPEQPKEPDKQSWCTKATRFKDKVDEATKKVEEAEKQRNAATMPGDVSSYVSAPVSSFEEKLAQARQELDTARQELSDFEQTAYSQGIPPGWLRCQFD